MLLQRIQQIVESALPEKVAFTLEVPPDSKFGDFACNAAMLLAKKLGRKPRELAEEIAAKIDKKLIAKVEVAGPGFLNLFLKPELYQVVLAEIEAAGENFGQVETGKQQKVLLEFISANPTGPLTVANGRGGFGGDTLARVLRWAGFAVATEYYVNDAGNQVVILGRSLQNAKCKMQNTSFECMTEDLYQGEYIAELAEQYPDKITDDAFETGRAFARILLEDEIKPAVAEMQVNFDRWFSEADLHTQGLVEKNIATLRQTQGDKNKVYESDGALWLRTTDFGDDKDRVLKKADGEWTYFAADIAYHADKFVRADRLIDIWGADHHGYIGRMQAAAQSLGRGNDLQIIITQLVKLFRGGEELKMSKRAGNFELMRDLIAEVGADAARWFFVMRDWNTHLNFDLDLAKAQSADNPVFYVQYAHARIASILRQAVEKLENPDAAQKGDLSLLGHSAELALIRKMAALPDLVAEIAEDSSVHKLTVYARELAEEFHSFYEQCRVIDSDDLPLSAARLRLTAAAKEVLHIVLSELVGVSAPEKM
jgi:arginyl-tRNA synthetase